MGKFLVVVISNSLIMLMLSVGSSTYKLNEVYNWKQVDFKYANDNARQAAIKSGAFIQKNCLPLGIEVWKNKLFVTLPRFRAGIPATLTYINLDDKSGSKSPKLIPYPNWDAQDRTKKGSRLASVWRLNVDVCDRLWMADSGIVEGSQVQTPRILVYDLKTDKLVVEYQVKKDQFTTDSVLLNLVVDVTSKSCSSAYAYVADVAGGLIVFDLKKKDSWRAEHFYFNFDPVAGDYNIGGVNTQWNDGIFGLALSPLNKAGYRTLYFHPLSSSLEFAVSTKDLQNKTGASDFHSYKILGSRGPNSQSTTSALDEKTGVLVYTQVQKYAVGCWNSVKYAERYSTATNGIIAQDKTTLTFLSDLKVDKSGNIWVISNRLPQYLANQLNPSETNFRIKTAPVAKAISGTVCDTYGYLTRKY